MRTTLLIIMTFPPALGFTLGAGLRGLLILTVIGLFLSGVAALVLGLCKVAGEADDRAAEALRGK